MNYEPFSDTHTIPQKLGMIARYFWRELTLACGIYTFFFVGGILAIRNAPAGQVFDLRPRGMGAVSEVLTNVGFITVLLVFYTLPIFFIRRSIARVLRVLMFALLVVFLTCLQAGEHIAVVRTADAFVFLKHYPFRSVSFPSSKLPAIKVHDTGTVKSLSLHWPGEYGSRESLSCLPVHRRDSATTLILQSLMSELTTAGGKLQLTDENTPIADRYN
jgi:hypothetical protein